MITIMFFMDGTQKNEIVKEGYCTLILCGLFIYEIKKSYQ